MKIRLNCSCGKMLRIDEKFKGKQGRCPNCSTIIDIPENIEAVPTLKDTYTGRKPYNPQELYESVADSVVGIVCEDNSGSGVLIDSSGLIATNRHVVGRNTNVTVRLNDGTEYPANVIRSFKDIDLAFAKVDLEQTKWAALSKTKKIKVGQSVFAIGHPLGLQNTLTKGIVSAVGRLIKGKSYVQTDAPINPGNSGGPLFNEYAEIVGINTMGIRESQGLGFAIPVEVVLEKYDKIKEDLINILEQRYCGVCGKNSRDEKYCEHCGAEVKLSSIKTTTTKSPTKQISKTDLTNCPSCKVSLEAVDTYCSKCGTAL